jgi:diguanylate cyclase (GGDEF)-like protein/PAS domain S-box-containing protein
MMAVAEPLAAEGSKSRVLVVDDEPQILTALEDTLGDEYEVLTATTPVLALRRLENEKDIAVVISDQRMPGMTGDELLSLLADLSDATRVMVTGYSEISAVIRAVNSGRIFAYVTKPWQVPDLRITVKKSVEHFVLMRKLARERQLLEDLMSNIPDAIYFKDRELRFERINQALASRIALDDAALAIGKRLGELGVVPEVASAVERAEALVVAEARASTNVLSSIEGPGGRRFYSTTVAPVMAPGGGVQGLVGVSRDVTEREETERALERLTHVRTILGAVNAAIVRVKDKDELVRESCRIAVDDGGLLGSSILLMDRERGMVTNVASHGRTGLLSKFVDAWTGVDADGVWNRATIVKSHRPVVMNHLRAGDDRPWAGEVVAAGGQSAALFPLLNDGRLVGVFVLVSAQPQFFDAEEVRLLSELADNIASALDHVEKRALLDFLAYYDELTNLPKRELLLDRLHQLLPARAARGEALALLLVDVSRFRHVNETLGRLAGDELLVQLSKRLAAIVADGDTLARFDGNAFAFLVTSAGDEAKLSSWIDKTLLAALAKPVVIRGTELRVTVRVGVALSPNDASDADGLVRNAEAALASAGTVGRNCAFYEPSMNARMGDKLTLEMRLRRALEEREFLLHYQPKVDLRNGGVVGLEALIRWHDPERGLVSPAQFIPILEETGLILDVGNWVLETATAQYVSWLEQGVSPPRIAVNVSSIQLSQPDFADVVERVLERYPRARGGLDLELTESVLMDDFGGNIEKLRALKRAGVRVAIDDFGTGYSSLGYLSRLPLDALKIDRSFVMRMTEDPQEMTIITTIISLAHSLDLGVVAEGVETADQARLLRLVRCDEIQGYLVGRPQPASEVVTQFRTSKATWPPPAA